MTTIETRISLLPEEQIQFSTQIPPNKENAVSEIILYGSKRELDLSLP